MICRDGSPASVGSETASYLFCSSSIYLLNFNQGNKTRRQYVALSVLAAEDYHEHGVVGGTDVFLSRVLLGLPLRDIGQS